MSAECLIYARHRGSGPLTGPVVFADDVVVVSHRPGGVPGHLFVETRRHVATLDSLTVAETAAVARAARLVAVGMRVRPASGDSGRVGVGRGVVRRADR
ncbi:hypothetical protein C8D88_1011021 [Lentzea atacamensis]|uniref:HIT domain-containing protein n=2 Tax=Lentzea TaxID=165301 RepID=A0A316IBV6_9PSEU|nr:hypothetical protein [Lentzea atacamensis]PWK90992.1 hypothetical protein C8D88_1011021 [Lentzea atacamensis]